jgi:hypothetical protein
LVQLDGSGSSDPNGDPLTYQWTQVSGIPVTLSDSTAVNPSFTSPVGLTQDEVLGFQLIVDDGQLSSAPDTVTVTVQSAAANNQVPIAVAGADQTVEEGLVVTLDGSGSSDPDGDSITYQWTQVSGIPVTLSDATSVNPDFIAPTGLTHNEVLTFELLVSDGQVSSTIDSVDITVIATTPSANIALLATVTASSETMWSTQTANKAIDGVATGYPVDYTREWATTGEGIGAWIELQWANPHLVDRIVLYDRPNGNDQIIAATLTFSNGTTVSVGPLENNGAGTEIQFAPRTITSIRLTVDQVGPFSSNIGLAEFEVFAAP